MAHWLAVGLMVVANLVLMLNRFAHRLSKSVRQRGMNFMSTQGNFISGVK